MVPETEEGQLQARLEEVCLNVLRRLIAADALAGAPHLQGFTILTPDD